MRPFEKVIIDYANERLPKHSKCSRVSEALAIVSIFNTKQEVAELLQKAAKAELEDEN